MLADALVVGEALGLQAQAAAAVEGLRRRLASTQALVASLPPLKHPNVAFLEWFEPLFPGACGGVVLNLMQHGSACKEGECDVCGRRVRMCPSMRGRAQHVSERPHQLLLLCCRHALWPAPGGHWTPQLIEMVGGKHPLNPCMCVCLHSCCVRPPGTVLCDGSFVQRPVPLLATPHMPDNTARAHVHVHTHTSGTARARAPRLPSSTPSWRS